MYYYVAREMLQNLDKICPFFLNLLDGNGVPFLERKILFPERKTGLWNERGHPLRWAREGPPKEGREIPQTPFGERSEPKGTKSL